MPNELIRNITSIAILFFLFVLFYSKFKRKSYMESLKDIRDNLKELFGSDE